MTVENKGTYFSCPLDEIPFSHSAVTNGNKLLAYNDATTPHALNANATDGNRLNAFLILCEQECKNSLLDRNRLDIIIYRMTNVYLRGMWSVRTDRPSNCQRQNRNIRTRIVIGRFPSSPFLKTDVYDSTMCVDCFYNLNTTFYTSSERFINWQLTTIKAHVRHVVRHVSM